MGKTIVYNGEEYSSISKLESKLGYNYGILRSRMSRGKTLEEAIAQGHNPNEVTVFGKGYSSVAEVARLYGIDEQRLRLRSKEMGSIEKALKLILTKETILYDGKEYESLIQLCNEYNIDAQTVSRRLHYGQTLERAITTPIKLKNTKGSYTYRGETFRTRRELASKYGFALDLIKSTALRRELDIVQVLDILVNYFEPHTLNRPQLIHRIPYAIVDGVWCYTRDEFSQRLGLKSKQLTAFMDYHKHNAENKSELTIQEALVAMKQTTKPAYLDVSTGTKHSRQVILDKYKRDINTLLRKGIVVTTTVPMYPNLEFNLDTIFLVKQDLEVLYTNVTN